LRSDVNVVLERRHRSDDVAIVDVHQIGAARQQWLRRQPDEMGLELIGDRRPVLRRGQHVAGCNFKLICQRDDDLSPRLCVLQIAFRARDSLYLGQTSGRQDHDLVAKLDIAARDGAGKIAPRLIERSHRHPEWRSGETFLSLQGLQIVNQTAIGSVSRLAERTQGFAFSVCH